jgi:hypothetical protein
MRDVKTEASVHKFREKVKFEGSDSLWGRSCLTIGVSDMEDTGCEAKTREPHTCCFREPVGPTSQIYVHISTCCLRLSQQDGARVRFGHILPVEEWKKQISLNIFEYLLIPRG